MNIWQFVPMLIALGGVYVFVGIIWLWLKIRGRADKRNPLTRDLLRAPGESLRGQIDDVWFHVMANMIMAPLLLLMVYATWVSDIAFGGKPFSVINLLVYGAILTPIFIWVCFKTWKLLIKKQLLTLGYEAELAVGQELNDLARQGYYIFHDLPAEKFNIDHVAIGPNGVFAIETKGRAKSKSTETTNEGWRVNYDGKALQFPTWQETESLAQATRQAKWLRDWVSSAVGEAINVQPVLVLPGWYVNRISPGGIPVLTGKQIASYLPKLDKGKCLDNAMIQRIVHQVDQRCRNIARRAYTAPKAD